MAPSYGAQPPRTPLDGDTAAGRSVQERGSTSMSLQAVRMLPAETTGLHAAKLLQAHRNRLH